MVQSTNDQPNGEPGLLHPLVSAALTAAGLTPQHGYQCVPVASLIQNYHPIVEIELPLLLYGFATLEAAQDLARLRAILQNAYPDAHPVTLVSQTAGTDTPNTILHTTVQALTIDMLLDPQVILCMPPMPAGSSFSALQAIIAHLRAPEGCPWDRKQTLMSMRHDLLGECAEVLEAIDLDNTQDNSAHIAEELGDLLMAGVLMVQIATDGGRFHMADAMQGIVTKLIRRHPHVFGNVVVDGVETVVTNWDAIKAQEKADKGQIERHPLDGVPAALPALEKARELQSKAAKAGLLDRAQLAQADPALAQWQQEPITEEALGELLWRIVALAHRAGLNAEDALRSYSTRFRAAY